ncbi:cbb3-type cytochrome oxidase subunit 3 [Planctobacterium marinum]|uniref:cbb3-type cytochrome oxidase subunit 3 n=1 Tax=Planctobacterium marinum TaxID=1631968 RepID=UPI001E63C3C1|nr:cbb3-type cytochrome c oxidase subunit 3 [Planctobacterium marinum]MCC2604011.1 cbb3-type cytochrome c oxidase subunit 3 [Planctobacterium marinum]
MDYGTIGSIFTVAVFVFFIGIVLWAYSKKSKAGFDEAANLVFDDEPKQKSSSTNRESSDNE